MRAPWGAPRRGAELTALNVPGGVRGHGGLEGGGGRDGFGSIHVRSHSGELLANGLHGIGAQGKPKMGCAREDRVDDGLGRPGRIARLRPGRLGSVGAGGLKDPTDTFWPLECILDWHLYYRTEAQMRKLTEMDGVERRELLLEETGNNFILKLWKDGGVSVKSRNACSADSQ